MDGSDGNGICFPYDVLLNILRRLPCRPLAKSRRVCRTWRALVDTHKLLLPYFFPRGPFPGIFTDNYGSHNESSFFAPPAPCLERPRKSRDGPVFRRPLFRHQWASVPHYCNGLLLLKDFSLDLYVCNPATTRYACLPRRSDDSSLFNVGMFLAFDPAVSLHYEVFLLRGEIRPDKEKAISTSVFSSQTMQWVSREFVPRHCAPGHLYDAVTGPHPSDMTRWNSAEYWHGSLYVHCWNNVIMILRNSEEVYDMVPLPGKAYADKEYVTRTTPLRRSVFASYEKGVHYVTFEKYQLHIWIMRESTDGQVRWMLTHEADLGPYGRQIDAYAYMEPKLQWEAVDSKKALAHLLEARNSEEIIYDEVDSQANTSDDIDSSDNDDDEDVVYDAEDFSDTTDDLEDGGQDEGDAHEDKGDELKSEEGSEHSWDSDEDNFIDVDGSAAHPVNYGDYLLIGLHPHKDVVIFLTPASAVAAYHVMTSRIQYLGRKLVKDPWSFYGANIAFPYRPCYVDALPAP